MYTKRSEAGLQGQRRKRVKNTQESLKRRNWHTRTGGRRRRREMDEQGFLQALLADPAGAETWLVLADWLEERDDPRFELVRLQHDRHYRPDLSPAGRDARVGELLASGLRP